MSRYICFINLEHVIFINGGSIRESGVIPFLKNWERRKKMKYLLAGRWNTLVFQYFNFRKKKNFVAKQSLKCETKRCIV
jgi:hypothetical protein